jgi:hypothetical protein
MMHSLTKCRWMPFAELRLACTSKAYGPQGGDTFDRCAWPWHKKGKPGTQPCEGS